MNKIQLPQLSYEYRAPDESLDPPEFTEVRNWIECEASTLLSGHDVKLGGRIIVHAYELSDIVAAEAVRRYTAGEDQDGMLGQLILAALDYEPARACGCALSIFGANTEWCDQAAIELLEPYAADILAQIIEDNRDDF